MSRALEPADRLLIFDLMARYNHSWDSGNAVAWADCFTASGRFEGLRGTCRGREELEAFCRLITSEPGAGLPYARQHWVSNVLLEAGDSRADAYARCHLMMVKNGPEGPFPDLLGWYEDELVRTLEGWRFSQRTVHRSPVAEAVDTGRSDRP